MNGVQQILSEYERLALAWDSERNSKKANRIFDKLHSLALILRESAEGRRGLESLLGHDNRGVRLKAGSDCLAWGSAKAISALEGLVQPRGFHSLDAEMTLREYRAGRMRFDW
ncbi:MAG: DUF2019 domain-containing protein [Phycicoccus sp.]|nr:DUF2019 domain-containing protein [Phycicoccus sp.]